MLSMRGMSQGCHWRMVVKWPDWCWDVGNSWWRRFWSPTSLSLWVISKCLFCHYMVIQALNVPEWMRWCWNDHFLILQWLWVTGVRVKWWNFWIKANALEFFIHHFVLISTVFYHLTLIQWLKWVWNGCQSFHTQCLPFQSFPFHSMAEWSWMRETIISKLWNKGVCY